MIRSGRIRRALRTRSRVVDLALALDVGRPRLHPDHVRLLEPQLGRVLDRRHPLVGGDEGREGVEQRRLAAAGAARDDDVDPGLDAGREELDHLRRDRLVRIRSSTRSGLAPEPADREQGAVQGQRRDDRVDAAAVGEPGVDHRAGLVHPPADPAHDPLDDLDQVPVVVERDVGPLQPALALDVDDLGAVDQDVADGRVGQEGSSGPRPNVSSITSLTSRSRSPRLSRMLLRLHSSSRTRRTSIRSVSGSTVLTAARFMLAISCWCSWVFSRRWLRRLPDLLDVGPGFRGVIRLGGVGRHGEGLSRDARAVGAGLPRTCLGQRASARAGRARIARRSEA